MKSRRNSRIYLVAALAAITLSLAVCAQAQTESTLDSFSRGTDGGIPITGLVADSAGNLYGVTASGGQTTGNCSKNHGCGVVFELSPDGTGGWTETVLYTFTGRTDGAFPATTLLLDTAGNLYGTTFSGGDLTSCSPYGCGVIFELSPGSHVWTETVLYSFHFTYGQRPNFMIRDAAGNFYGTTALGGPSNSGTVFKLSLGSSGWVETVLYTFSGGADGIQPTGIALDPAGNIYGTIFGGGNLADCAKLGCGQVFKLTSGSGGWHKTVVYNFAGGADGSTPQGLVLDAAGHLYVATFGGGSTTCGGLSGCGAVFRLIKGASGWRESLIYKFTGTNGKNPEANLLLDSAGNLYGTTTEGGLKNSNCDASGCGLVFKLAPTSGGWGIPATLHEFGSTDGAFPQSTPLHDAAA